jgi:hypothetical protein
MGDLYREWQAQQQLLNTIPGPAGARFFARLLDIWLHFR